MHASGGRWLALGIVPVVLFSVGGCATYAVNALGRHQPTYKLAASGSTSEWIAKDGSLVVLSALYEDGLHLDAPGQKFRHIRISREKIEERIRNSRSDTALPPDRFRSGMWSDGLPVVDIDGVPFEVLPASPGAPDIPAESLPASWREAAPTKSIAMPPDGLGILYSYGQESCWLFFRDYRLHGPDYQDPFSCVGRCLLAVPAAIFDAVTFPIQLYEIDRRLRF
jgi:hypothetical protein